MCKARLHSQRLTTHYFLLCDFVYFWVRVERFTNSIRVVSGSNDAILASGKIRPLSFWKTRVFLHNHHINHRLSINTFLEFCDYFSSHSCGISATCLGFSLKLYAALVSGSPLGGTQILRSTYWVFLLKGDPLIAGALLYQFLEVYLARIVRFLHRRLFPIRLLDGSQRHSSALRGICTVIVTVFLILPHIGYRSNCSSEQHAFSSLFFGVFLGACIKVQRLGRRIDACVSEMLLFAFGLWSDSLASGIALASHYNIWRSMFWPAIWFHGWRYLHSDLCSEFWHDSSIILFNLFMFPNCVKSIFAALIPPSCILYCLHAGLVIACCQVVPQNLGGGPDDWPDIEILALLLLSGYLRFVSTLCWWGAVAEHGHSGACPSLLSDRKRISIKQTLQSWWTKLTWFGL